MLVKKKNNLALLFLMFAAFNLYAQGKKTFSKEHAAKLRQLRASVERDPDNLQLNQQFISAWGEPPDSLIILQYRRWVNKFPNSYVIPFAIGEALLNSNADAKEFLLKATKLKPDLSKAWYSLAINANVTGDTLQRNEYLKKAVETDPNNLDYAFSYAITFEKTDTAVYRSRMLDLLKKNPESELGVTILYWLANNEKNAKQKIAYYESVKEKYDKRKGYWYNEIMNAYFEHSLFIDPQKALEIAQLQKLSSQLGLADTIGRAKKLLAEHHATEAYLLTQHLRLRFRPRNMNLSEQFLLWKANIADAAQQTKVAYDSIALYYSMHPSDTLQKVMYYYGTKLGLPPEQLEARIKALRVSTAKPATGFSLINYLTNKKVSLADFKGKVILLTYWFPTCGPCREEFPHFEHVIKKFNSNDVVYLGVNMYPSQDSYIIPFLKSTGFSFIPLRDAENRNKGTLPSPYAPANYLIDRSGRMIFSDFTIDSTNERTLELMIKELMKAD